MDLIPFLQAKNHLKYKTENWSTSYIYIQMFEADKNNKLSYSKTMLLECGHLMGDEEHIFISLVIRLVQIKLRNLHALTCANGTRV